MEANDQNIYIPNLCSNGLDLTQGIIFPQRGGEPKFESFIERNVNRIFVSNSKEKAYEKQKQKK